MHDNWAINSVDLTIACDPTEPVATRPLVMQRNGGWNFFYTHDGNKNVSDVVSFQQARGVPAHYEYAPFGEVTVSATNTAFTAFNVAATNPFRFSSEYADDALGLVYYNYRHYSILVGMWGSRDMLDSFFDNGLYRYCHNSPLELCDALGMLPISGASSIHAGDAEGQFDKIAASASENWSTATTGEDILNDFRRLSESGNCIGRYTIAGHGWTYRDGAPERTYGPGIPASGNGRGFYIEKQNEGSIGLEDLRMAIDNKEVCFCKDCKVQIYSCRISPAFSLQLSRITGCTIVSATSSCRALDDGSGKWRSAPGSWDERSQNGYTGFYEIGPLGVKGIGHDYQPF